VTPTLDTNMLYGCGPFRKFVRHTGWRHHRTSHSPTLAP
jgi:hypothetical protein